MPQAVRRGHAPVSGWRSTTTWPSQRARIRWPANPHGCGVPRWSEPRRPLTPKQMKEWTPNSKYGGHAFRLRTFPEFLAERDKILPWIAEYSPYALVSKGDPPVYLTYSRPPALGQDQKDPTHTSNFGVKLQEHCRANGVACELVYPGAPDVEHATTTDYLIETLKAERTH